MEMYEIWQYIICQSRLVDANKLPQADISLWHQPCPSPCYHSQQKVNVIIVPSPKYRGKVCAKRSGVRSVTGCFSARLTSSRGAWNGEWCCSVDSFIDAGGQQSQNITAEDTDPVKLFCWNIGDTLSASIKTKGSAQNTNYGCFLFVSKKKSWKKFH